MTSMIQHLLKAPIVKPLTPEWHQMRKNMVTATNLSEILSYGSKGRKNLLESKAFPGSGKKNLIGIPAIRHGVMFEPMAARSYSQATEGPELIEVGLVTHPELSCFGATPDAVDENGKVVEFKCPYSRVIDGISIPKRYRLQILGQMAACRLEVCDYVECVFKKYPVDEYRSIVEARGLRTRNHGIVLETGPHLSPTFAYSPSCMTVEESIGWMRDQKDTRVAHAWILVDMKVQSEEYDERRWNDLVPHIRTFWEKVLEMRST